MDITIHTSVLPHDDPDASVAFYRDNLGFEGRTAVRNGKMRWIPAAYRPVLANQVFRRLILGFAVSYLGDGMSFVAVAWLAIELAPQATVGLWVGGAVAAYTLPGVVGALAFGRRLRRAPARRLLLADNIVRGIFIGAIPLPWLAGWLTLPLSAVLLAVSSVLHARGSAGQYTLLAEPLPD